MKYNIYLFSVIIGIILQISVIISTNATNTTNTTPTTTTTSTTELQLNGTSNNVTREAIDEINIHIQTISQTSPTTSSIQSLEDEYESIVNGINGTTAQNQEVFNNVLQLSSDMMEFIISGENSNQTTAELFSVFLTVERFIDRVALGLPSNAFSGQSAIVVGRIQVTFANVDLSVQLSDITIPDQSTTSSQSPAANVPITELILAAETDGVVSFYISSIVFDSRITIQNGDQTTQFLSLNFHLQNPNSGNTFVDRINLTFPHNLDNPVLITNPQCFFINNLAEIDTGVNLVSFNEQVIVCATNHLTSFAAIVRVPNETDNTTIPIIDEIIIHIQTISQTSPNASSIQSLVDEYERIVNGINGTTAQNQEVFNNVLQLSSDMIEFIISGDNSNQTTAELFSVFLTVERFIDRLAQSLPNNAFSGQASIIVARIQVTIAYVDLAVQSSDIIIPDQPLSPAANVPITVLNQVAQINGVTPFYISSIVFDLSVTIQNDQTTQFLSLNFHLPIPINGITFIERINLTFPHNFQNPGLFSNPQCVFINNLAVIDTTGVDLVSFNDQTIVCATNHLTSFAAIVRFNRATSRGEDLASRIVSFLLLSASFLALSISLILFCLAGKPFFRSLPNLIYFNYAVALTFACGTFIFLLPTSVLNNRYCVVSSLFTQYIWTSVFTWSVCISIVLVQFFKEERVYDGLRYFIIYFMIGWGIPIIPCIITFCITIPNGIIEDYISYDSQLLNLTCYLSNAHPTYTVWGLLGPILILLVINSVALSYLTVRLCLRLKPNKINMKSSSSTFYLQYRTLYFQFLILISILGLPWFFAVVNIITRYSTEEGSAISIVMEWIYIFLNGPIGVVFFFAYTIRNAQVKDMLSKEPKYTIFTSQQAVSNFSNSKECTLPSSIPKPRKPPVKSDV